MLVFHALQNCHALQNNSLYSTQNWVSVSDGSRTDNGGEFQSAGRETANIFGRISLFWSMELQGHPEQLNGGDHEWAQGGMFAWCIASPLFFFMGNQWRAAIPLAHASWCPLLQSAADHDSRVMSHIVCSHVAGGNVRPDLSEKKWPIVNHFLIMWHTDIDECKVNNGDCNNLCVNIVGDFYCLCDDGYALFDGKVCLGYSHYLSLIRTTVTVLHVLLIYALIWCSTILHMYTDVFCFWVHWSGD